MVCKPELFDFFRDALSEAFPLGSDHVRTTLDRLVPTRNALYHSNPISVRQAEQAICYSNDTLASLKAYYERKNMGDQFNAPTIIRISDSLGNVFHSAQLTDLGGVSGRAAIRNNQHPLATLHAGETLSLEIEVDPSFDRAGYSIQWHVPNDRMVQNNSERLTLQLEAKHVAKTFQLQAMLVSTKPFHRYGTHDDSIAIAYCVLPPR